MFTPFLTLTVKFSSEHIKFMQISWILNDSMLKRIEVVALFKYELWIYIYMFGCYDINNSWTFYIKQVIYAHNYGKFFIELWMNCHACIDYIMRCHPTMIKFFRISVMCFLATFFFFQTCNDACNFLKQLIAMVAPNIFHV